MTAQIGLSPMHAGSTNYKIQRSLRFIGANPFLYRTPSTAGNRKTWTYSVWVKRGFLAAYTGLIAGGPRNTSTISFGFYNTDQFFYTISGVGTALTTQTFRDPNAWMHVVIAFDSTQAVQADRSKLFINGSRILYSSDIVTQDTDYDINNAIIHMLGVTAVSGTGVIAAMIIAEARLIDGQALAPGSFGQFDQNNNWVPIEYNGTYGTNGFYLPFTDYSNTTAATLGKDRSGNNNDMTPNGFSVSTTVNIPSYCSLIDTPTNYDDGGFGRGNYANLNPLSSNALISIANLQTYNQSTSAVTNALGSMALGAGKWYWEVTCTTLNSGGSFFIGLAADCGLDAIASSATLGSTTSGYAISSADGSLYFNNTATTTGGSGALVVGDTIGIAVDIDAKTISFYKNGAIIYSALTTQLTSLLTNGAGFVIPAASLLNSYLNFNFGQRPFAYTPPTGYLTINTQNLVNPVTQPYKHAAVSLWTGNNGTQSVSNGFFKPDFLLIKNRSNALGSILQDTTRGAGKTLTTTSTAAEVSNGIVTSFDSTGFTLNNGTGDNVGSLAAWQLKAGDSVVTNTQGSVSAQVSANRAAGISVVSLVVPSSGNFTFGHGLSSAPKMVICKSRAIAGIFGVFHAGMSTPLINYGALNTTGSVTTGTVWGALPSASIVSINTGSTVFGGTSAGNSIAYVFAEVPGFSRMGWYSGNANSSGRFVWCGFRPKFILIRSTAGGTGNGWYWFDTTRNTVNPLSNVLFVESTAVEESGVKLINVFSNGFQVNVTTAPNVSGVRYFFTAFAENPFKTARAR